MKAPDIFGVVVRTIGLWLIIWGLWQMLGGVDSFIENLFSESSDNVPAYSYFFYGVPAFIFGAICLFLADWIVKITYRD
jgi:hypothetical protein